RRNVVADRRDEADAGDRDAALADGHTFAFVSSSLPRATTSSVEFDAILPSIRAASLRVAVSSAPGVSVASSSSAVPGGMNERILMLVIFVAFGVAPGRKCVALRATSIA